MTGTEQLQRQHVLAVNVRVLADLGVKRAVIDTCRECGQLALMERPGYLLVCGYCGADDQLARPELIPWWQTLGSVVRAMVSRQ